jgi:hypothetical protein
METFVPLEHRSLAPLHRVYTPGIRMFRLADHIGQKLGRCGSFTLSVTDDEIVRHFGINAVRHVPPEEVMVCGLLESVDGEVLMDALTIDLCVTIPTLLLAAIKDGAFEDTGMLRFGTYTGFCISHYDGRPKRVSIILHEQVVYLAVFTNLNSPKPRVLTPNDRIVLAL